MIHLIHDDGRPGFQHSKDMVAVPFKGGIQAALSNFIRYRRKNPLLRGNCMRMSQLPSQTSSTPTQLVYL